MNSKKSDFVKFEQVDKSYDGKELVVKGLDLDIAEGEFLPYLDHLDRQNNNSHDACWF